MFFIQNPTHSAVGQPRQPEIVSEPVIVLHGRTRNERRVLEEIDNLDDLEDEFKPSRFKKFRKWCGKKLETARKTAQNATKSLKVKRKSKSQKEFERNIKESNEAMKRFSIMLKESENKEKETAENNEQK